MTGLMAYGIHFTLFVMTACLLMKQRHTMRRASFYLTYTCLQFTLSSIGMWRDVVGESVSYLEHGNDPAIAGPIEYYNVYFRSPPEWVSVLAFAACTWLQDGLLLYRCLLFYSNKRVIIVLPALLFIGSIVTSILFIIEVATSRDLYGSTSIDLGIPYWALSIAFNLVVTLLIIARLYVLRREVRRSLTPDAADVYTSVGAMLVESAALYSVTGLVFIACYARDSGAQYVFITWLGQFESISPLLIILRVAQGRAWSASAPPPVTNPANVIRLNHMRNSHKAGEQAASGVSVTVETVTADPGTRFAVDAEEEKKREKWHRLGLKSTQQVGDV